MSKRFRRSPPQRKNAADVATLPITHPRHFTTELEAELNGKAKGKPNHYLKSHQALKQRGFSMHADVRHREEEYFVSQ